MQKKKKYWMKNDYKNQFEVCARAIIKDKGRILVCWHKEKKYHFFPGGHVEFGESAKAALVRELKEELDIKVKKISLFGVFENMYIEKNDIHPEHRGLHHEINFVFEVTAKNPKDKSLEDHIDFVFLDKNKFKKTKVFPLSLQKLIKI